MVYHTRRRRSRQAGAALASAAAMVVGGASVSFAQFNPYNTVSLSSVSTNAYGADDINSCSIDLNDLVTDGNYQFIAYYNNSGDVVLGRRATSTSADNTNPWTLDTTHLTPTSGITDDHDVISIAVDGNGDMHLSWGMHNAALQYDISSNSVLGTTFSPTFVNQTSTNDPGLFANLGSIDQVTYPQFYNIPNSSNLLFVYRDAAAASGGGSGDGNEFFAIYNAATKTYSAAQNVEMMDGGITSVNGYMNNLLYTPSGTLIATWTWRATPNWQTNSNILYAQSPNNGASWYQFGGTTQYALPIIQNTSGGGTAAQVAQAVVNIPENDSFINQTSEAIDNNGNPMVASYLTPGWNVNTNSGNPNRQYVLEYYNGSSWQQSVISDRTSDTSIDTSGDDVRDLGRPLVMVDSSNRIIVVTRSEDTSMGSYDNPSTPNNDIVVYYTTASALDAGSPDWRSTTLEDVNMGEYEPTYDPHLWASSNILDLMYEPEGLTGEGEEPISVLQWNEQAFFQDGISWNNATNGIPVGDGYTWDNQNNANWNNGTTTVNFLAGDNVTFNDTNDGNYNITLNTTVSPGNITVNTAGSYSITGSGTIAASDAYTQSGTGTMTIGTGFTAKSVNIAAGALVLATNTTLGSGTVTSNVTISSLTIGSNGVLDIENNHIIITYGSSDPLSTIYGYLVSGYNNGNWNGPGIISSTARSINGSSVYGIGFADGADGVVNGLSSGQIELKYTLLGDANLDGTVNGSDFSILAANFGLGVTNWDQGNFLYGSSVNGSDFSALAANFGQGDNGAAVSVSQADIAALDAFAAANGLLADVPEPASAASLALMASALLTRRRSNRALAASRPSGV
jgi:hypothetical protein